jgi:hypothetical protein
MINSIYWYSLTNRKDAMQTQGIRRSYHRFLGQSIIYSIGILAKIFLSKFYQVHQSNHNQIRLSWTNTFYQRLLELPGEIPLFHYNYKSFQKNQILFFKNVSLYKTLKETGKIRKSGNSCFFEQDNLFYRFIIASETLMFISFFKLHPSIKRVYIAGINDRQTVMLSEICFGSNICLSVLQHGCFTKFLNQYKVTADEFFYFYSFSLNYLKYFFKDIDNIKVKHLPRKYKLEDLPIYDNPINIAYATTPILSSINFKIINLLLQDLNEKVTLIINPHPVDNLKDYEKMYGRKSNVIITNVKYKNVKYFFLRYSTLGIEMSNLGIDSVYINLENYQTDFFDFGQVTVFNNLDPFKNWLYKESKIKYYYRK